MPALTGTLRPNRRRPIILTVLLILPLICAHTSLTSDSSTPARASAAAPLARISIDLAAPQRLIPRDFQGLSTDYPAVQAYIGASPAAPNTVFRQLLKNLGHGSLRLGGDTQDTSCWGAVRGSPRTCMFRFGPSLPRSVFTAAVAAHWTVIMGLNLGLNDPRTAVAYVRHGIIPTAPPPTLLGLEIGNEPDFYSRIGLRPPSYSLGRYIGEFNGYVTALENDRQTRDLPLVGPAFFIGAWAPRLGRFIDGVGSRHLSFVTLHYYPFSVCGVANRANATIPHLLSPNTISTMQRQLASALRLARSRGLALRVDEMNSVSCHGKAGVSDTFASALWGMDALFSLAEMGVRGVNFHLYDPGRAPGYYNAIVSVATRSPGGAWSYRTAVRPLYYAMLMFSAALGSRLLFTRITGRRANITAYAVADRSRLRVFILNKDPTRSGSVVVAPSRPLGPAAVTVLRAPQLSSVTGVTLGGQVIDPATGRMPAPHTEPASTDRSTNTYRVLAPVASAIILSFRLH